MAAGNESGTKKEGSASKAVIVKSPQSMTMFTGTARCILDELRDRHKTIEKNGGKKVHPSELLTLDKLIDSLVKFSNLPEQGRTPEAVDQALRLLTDIDSRGKDRYLYLYPFLLKNANKVVAKIALIAPQTTHEQDVKNYREACFEYSKTVLDLMLSNRAKKPKDIDEVNPGASLFQKNKSGQDWLYPNRFAIESEITLLIKSGFKPYSFLPIKDFVEDFIDYGNAKASLEQFSPTYHMIIDEIAINSDGSYKRQPELIIHYRAQVDGLEKFALPMLAKLADEGVSDYRQKVAQFRKEHVDNADKNRSQSRDKAKALIKLIKDFPFSRVNSELAKNVKTTCEESIQILEKMIDKMDNVVERKYDSIFKSIIQTVGQYISEFTKTNLKLMKLDIEKEVENAGIKDPPKIQEIGARVLKELAKTYVVKNSELNGSKVVYAVDQSYMAGVLHKYGSIPKDSQEVQHEFELVKQMNQELTTNGDTRLNINIRKDHIDKLNLEVLRQEQDERDKIRSDFFNTKFNFLAGFLALGVSLIISLFLFSVENEILYMIFGIPLSIAAGYFSAILIKKREKTSSNKNLSQAEMQFKALDTEETSDEKVSQIAKAATKFIYPASYQKIVDKVYDNDSLKNKIQKNFSEIKNSVGILAREEDSSKVASSIEHAILNTSIVINIPQEIVPLGKPNVIIMSKADFKAPLTRTQLAEFYRTELDKNKIDKQMVKYFTFLINTLEIEYPKFLNKKIR
ncbi:MAG: hypothetical protein SFU98_22430 [Leptospiraceae bacterium]|nr:hypothetical protein [Leptospiraceae bacterium]